MSTPIGTIVEGARIARAIKEDLHRLLQKFSAPPSLGVVVCALDLATQKFIAIKQKNALELGIPLQMYDVAETVTTQALKQVVAEASLKHDGVIVQFPLPEQVDTDAVRNEIPPKRDIDLVSDGAFSLFKEGKSPILPPVVGALKAILDTYQVSLQGKHVVVVGEGRLVGIPAKVWAEREGAHVVTLNARSQDIGSITQTADVLILGAGVPGLVTPSMVKEGVVVLDAGTSEALGKLAGDAQPAVASKASLFTPVPGGVGPITISVLFRNLIMLSGGLSLDGGPVNW